MRDGMKPLLASSCGIFPCLCVQTHFNHTQGPQDSLVFAQRGLMPRPSIAQRLVRQ
ncbi:hypothetical protein M2222_001264 [Bradyrhizobium elkanii]|nr:hypothetical protein [Bradyrhizobium elkanii]